MAYNKETGMYEGFIYLITNKVNNKKYVGQTRTSIKHRWEQHISCNGKDVLYIAFRKYGKENFLISQVEKIQSESLDELLSLLNEKEIYYIDKFKSLKHQNGYNMTIGGNNHSVYNRYPNCAYNKKGELLYEANSISEMSLLTGYDKGAIKDCCDGKLVPKKDIIFRYKNDPFDKYDIKEKTTAKKVYQFALSGKLLNVYNSLKDAAKSVNGTISGINNVLVGQNKTYKNYYWSHNDIFDFNKIIDIKISVDKYSLNGDYLITYESIVAALNDINIDISKHSSITKCCKGEIAYAYGFVWRYSGEDFNKYRTLNRHCKRLNCYTKEDIFVRTYVSAAEAGKELCCDSSNITACAKGKTKTSNGFKWYYINDTSQPDKTKITSN